MKHLLKYSDYIKENTTTLTNDLLDKINRDGINSLTQDERKYLDTQDSDLGRWLMSDDDRTFDYDDTSYGYGKKLKYDEFEFDEDVLWNREKLIRVINKMLPKTKSHPKSHGADWYGKVWFLKEVSPNIGIYLHLGDDELEVIQRSTIIDEDEVEDEILETITTGRELYKIFNMVK